MKRLALCLLALPLLLDVPLVAHHSFTAVYFDDRDASIQVEVVQFVYRNPHSFVHVLAPDVRSGAIVRWAVEWQAGGQLGQRGITPGTLRPGDRVVITGSPGRNPADHSLRLRTIVRPKDGWRWRDSF